jgi:hypothetical protein
MGLGKVGNAIYKKSLPVYTERLFFSGRYWVRTSDPLLVRQVL